MVLYNGVTPAVNFCYKLDVRDYIASLMLHMAYTAVGNDDSRSIASCDSCVDGYCDGFFFVC